MLFILIICFCTVVYLQVSKATGGESEMVVGERKEKKTDSSVSDKDPDNSLEVSFDEPKPRKKKPVLSSQRRPAKKATDENSETELKKDESSESSTALEIPADDAFPAAKAKPKRKPKKVKSD